jgi:hypothetical protein
MKLRICHLRVKVFQYGIEVRKTTCNLHLRQAKLLCRLLQSGDTNLVAIKRNLLFIEHGKKLFKNGFLDVPVARHFILPVLALTMSISTMESDNKVFRNPRLILFPALLGIVMMNYFVWLDFRRHLN